MEEKTRRWALPIVTKMGHTQLWFELVLLGLALFLSVVQRLLAGRLNGAATLSYTEWSGHVVAFAMSSAAPWDSLFTHRRWLRASMLLLPIALVASISGGLAGKVAFDLPWTYLLKVEYSDIPYATVISYALGIVMFAVASTRVSLEAERLSLAEQVQRGNAALETHSAELRAAYEIQSGLLPKELPKRPGFDVSCAWQPAKTVSGDYFNVLSLSDTRLGLCLADVCGKGLSAALVTANLDAAFRVFATAGMAPSEVCSKLNAALCETLPTGKFVSFVYAVLDLSAMTLTYESAGHHPALLVRGQDVTKLEGSGPVLGIFPQAAFLDQTVSLLAGDCLVLCTDGVLEAVCEASGEEFGERRMAAVVLRSPDRGARQIQSELMSEVTAFASGVFADDASLIVVTLG